METYELTLSSHPGALARVVALVSGRRWTLHSLNFPPIDGDRRLVTLRLDTGGRGDQALAQFAKLYDVLGARLADA